MGEVFPGLEDPTVEALMAGYSKRRLAETIVVNQRQVDQLSRELAALEQDKATLVREYANLARETQLLAGRRDRVLAFLDRIDGEPPCPPCEKWVRKDVRRMLTTDPRDEDSHGA